MIDWQKKNELKDYMRTSIEHEHSNSNSRLSKYMPPDRMKAPM